MTYINEIGEITQEDLLRLRSILDAWIAGEKPKPIALLVAFGEQCQHEDHPDRENRMDAERYMGGDLECLDTLLTYIEDDFERIR